MNSVAFYRIGALVAAAMGALLVGVSAGLSHSRSSERFGLRGLKRKRALDESSLWQIAEPLVRWLGVRVSSYLSEGRRASIDRKIALAGDFKGLVPEEFVALTIVTTVLGVCAGVIACALHLVGGLMVALCATFGVFAPTLVLSSAYDERVRNVNRRLPYAIDLLALAMSAGLDFPGSLRQIVEKSAGEDPLIDELKLMLQGLQLGRSRKQVLETLAERAPSDDVKEFVSSLIQAEMRGTPIANVLQIQAGVSRQRRTTRAEESAAKAGVKMAGPLMLLFLAILMLIVAPMVMKLKGQF
ncbi:MAG: type II secretion system F family protein [Polyangiales bacterium]